MKLAALLLAVQGTGPAAANPQAIAEALALCLEVVKAESPEPLEKAGLEVLNTRSEPPQWSITTAAPAGIGEIRAGMDEYGGQAQTEEYHCHLHLPAPNRSAATRWEKLGHAPVMALVGEGFEHFGGSPAAPRLASCPMVGKPLYVSFTHNERVQGVRLTVSDLAPRNGDPCEE